jgi:hypothetical protein
MSLRFMPAKSINIITGSVYTIISAPRRQRYIHGVAWPEMGKAM